MEHKKPMQFLKFSLIIFLITISFQSIACVNSPLERTTIKYIEPCVTDACIKYYLKNQNGYSDKHCLASIQIEGITDWAYTLGKKCNSLKSGETYNIETTEVRCYKNAIPRFTYTSSYYMNKKEKAFFKKQLEIKKLFNINYKAI